MDEEKILIQEVKAGNKSAFALIFRKYYKDLVMFAGNYVSEKEICEDFVQNIFLKFWNERENIHIKTSLRAFLIKSVQNACLDHIRHQQVVRNHANNVEAMEMALGLINPEQYTFYSELQTKLTSALDKLPQNYKQIIELSKIEGKKHKEISALLNISERTVEDRISKALKLLRNHLKDFLR